MGEVSGDSSSPLLEIPFPISQAQRAGLHYQAPTQLCYLSLSLHAHVHAHTHTDTNILIQADKTDTIIPRISTVRFSCVSLTNKDLKTKDYTYFFCQSSSFSHTNTQRQILDSATHKCTFWQVESFSFLSVCIHASSHTRIHREELNKSFTSLLHL